jgi:hypothetical protein
MSAGIALAFGAGVGTSAAVDFDRACDFSGVAFAFFCAGAGVEGGGTMVNSGGRDGSGVLIVFGAVPSRIREV